jgi:subtilisin family serine protease
VKEIVDEGYGLNNTTDFSCPDRQGPAPSISWSQERLSTRYPSTVSGLTGSGLYDAKWGENVDIYVLDTGVRTTHEEFDKRAVWGTQFATGTPNTDVQGHGTIVAGIAAGARYGIAKAATVIAVKVCKDNGGCSDADIVAGIEWSVNNARQTGRKGVGNISISGAATAGGDPTTAAVNAAADAGFLFVVAAGNDSRDACLNGPGQAEKGLTVGSTQYQRTISDGWFDNKASSSNFGRCLSVFAPGVEITSAGWQWTGGSDTSYYRSSGTSMAAPHVAAVAAIGLQQNPTFTPAQLKQWVVENSVSDLVQNAGSGSPNKMANLPCL